MLENFYTRRAAENRMSQKSAATLKTMTNARSRLIRKLIAQKSELDETSKRDYLRQCGDIITANFHMIKKGQESLIADDFYSQDGSKREIKLDPHKTPQQNAAKYYKAYTKAKNAQKFLSELIEKGEDELEYINSVIEQFSRAENEQDLNEIREELLLTGYLKKQKQQMQHKQRKNQNPAKQKHKLGEVTSLRFLSTSGHHIYVGRNNKQNDMLTMKAASGNDLWFHAQKISGAHVILSCAGTQPDKRTLEEAAAIAAYYSGGCDENKVSVDYTRVKDVKKPQGARPGNVIYYNFNTIIITPDKSLVKQLRDDS